MRLDWRYRNQTVGDNVGWRAVDERAWLSPSADVEHLQVKDSEREAVV